MILNQTPKIHRQIINISRPEDGVFLPYFWIHMVLKSHWIPLHSINSHANWRMAATENMGQPPNRFRKNWRQISINYIIISYKIPINPPLVPSSQPGRRWRPPRRTRIWPSDKRNATSRPTIDACLVVEILQMNQFWLVVSNIFYFP